MELQTRAVVTTASAVFGVPNCPCSVEFGPNSVGSAVVLVTEESRLFRLAERGGWLIITRIPAAFWRIPIGAVQKPLVILESERNVILAAPEALKSQSDFTGCRVTMLLVL